MSTQPFTAARFRALDANGNPLSGGLLYTYAAGTNTPQATYTDRAGGSANTNPVVLDANGEADVWLTAGVDYQFTLLSSTGSLQWTVDNYPSPVDSSASTDVAATEPGGRLTLTSGTPVTTSDVTAATSIYYAPYKHSKVPLYDGTTWALYSIGTGISQATTDTTKSPAAVTTNSNYDLFVWNDAGTVRLSRGPLWTSDTARGSGVGTTELRQVNGRYVNKNAITNGPGAQLGLYVGTVRSDGFSQVNDSLAKRHVWNCHNRVRRSMKVVEATATWTYSSATVRQANGSAANQLDFVIGLSEDAVNARARAAAADTITGVQVGIGIGLDSTTAISSDCIAAAGTPQGGAGQPMPLSADYVGFPGLGRHYLAWLESGPSSGAGTFFGATLTVFKAGITGDVPA